MDSTLMAGVIGAAGSICGGVVGALLGYSLANRKANVSVFPNNRFFAFYRQGQFCMYLPITISNDGNRGAVVHDFSVSIAASSGLEFQLTWGYFSTEVPEEDYCWKDGARAAPIYIHAASGVQYALKFFANGDSPDGVSRVVLPAGKHRLIVRHQLGGNSERKASTYSFLLDESGVALFEKRRLDQEDNSTVVVPLRERV